MQKLVWFRNDLHTVDNTALDRACEERDARVIGVYCITIKQWTEMQDWGSPKIAFVLRQAEALKRSLAKLNIPLKIVTADRFSDLAPRLVQLAESLSCDEIYFNREYAWYEKQRDEAVAIACREAGIETQGFHDAVLFEPGSILSKSQGSFYSVFSPFKKSCWKQYRSEFHESGGWPLASTPERRLNNEHESDELPEYPEYTTQCSIDFGDWPTGETKALDHLADFIRTGLAGYHDARDLPAERGTARLSPYLSAGVLSPRQCMNAALDANQGKIDEGKPGAVGWMNELLWREFYRHVIVGFPHVSRNQNFNNTYDGVPWRDSPENLAAWKAGQTGYPLVDAAMRCLTETGWMHNRLRMVTAMFLTKHLLIDWREGERHFMQSLIDADFPSNNGGWQWSASTGTDAQPYFRVFNPTTQSERFDKNGEFIRRWVEELRDVPARKIHEPDDSIRDKTGYPSPIVEHKRGRERAIQTFKDHRSA